MSIDQLLVTFITESRELLDQMEGALLECEREPPDAERINAIFRAAHTIKGSGGLFGLDHIVQFTHALESVLDEVRAGQRELSASLISLLLECCDHVRKQVEAVARGASGDAPDMCESGRVLLGRLGHDAASKPGEAPFAERRPVSEPRVDGGVLLGSADTWHISLRFGPDVLRHGMDPLSFLKYLSTFGEIVSAQVVSDAMPAPDAMDPETCYLGFEISFRTEVDKERIESTFEFVRDDCRLRILPPRSQIDDYVELIRGLPESDGRLGELLVECGTLTRHELSLALAKQAGTDGAESTGLRLGEILVAEKMVPPRVVEAALEKQGQAKDPAQRGAEVSSIRVESAKLDRLIDLIGELTVVGATAELGARRAGLVELRETANALARLVAAVRDSALTLRMVPIGATFSRFHRVVREVATQLGKQIDLSIEGGETELDKTIVERIADPLIHLVRNSADHGIEMPEVRSNAGKAERGTIRLNAFHDSGSIVIEISDDGAGIDGTRLLEKARERGIVADDAVLTRQETLSLVFAPGLSTAAAVTNLSGRGVGMDVVKKNIEQLRGSVNIESELGRGTTVRIRLPLTLAIIDGFLLRVANVAYVVPLEVIDECVDLPEPGDGVASGDYLQLRGQLLPLLRLREQFGALGAPPRRQSVVVVRWGQRRVGLAVDALLGKYQAVIKPLSPVFQALKGVTGSTILGDGSVALILDVPALADQADARTRAGARASSSNTSRIAMRV